MPSTLDQTDTLRISRRFKANRDRVFAAFTTLDAMMSWFGPAGCTMRGDSLDFRVGGQYRLRIDTPDGEAIVAGTYREITPPSKLVFTWQWQDDEDWVDKESVITCEFHAHGSETELTLTQVGFPVPESRGRHEHGWTGCFDKLDAALAD
jgi:uncharacterized protein YndB with AHSA1/START domain